MGLNGILDTVSQSQEIILDGSKGSVIIQPSDEERSKYENQYMEYADKKKIWSTYVNKETITADGMKFEISANIGSLDDLDSALANGADGIGLFRTEFFYLGRQKLPTEDEQFLAYKTVLEKMGTKPVVIRTLDIGGDKHLDYLELEKELNPFLGKRAIRFCLSNPGIFETQIRALLRASVYGNLHIMLPMIATVEEFRQAKAFIEKELSQMKKEGILTDCNYKLGIMIEIPAAAMMADIFAKEVDFFSIGTNDLIQYTMAADRMNEQISYLYQPFNPAILRLIKNVADAAHKEGKWVGMCGEMASEEKALNILLGLGLDELSMSASVIPKTRYQSSNVDTKQAKVLSSRCLNCESEGKVIGEINEFLIEP